MANINTFAFYALGLVKQIFDLMYSYEFTRNIIEFCIIFFLIRFVYGLAYGHLSNGDISSGKSNGGKGGKN